MKIEVIISTKNLRNIDKLNNYLKCFNEGELSIINQSKDNNNNEILQNKIKTHTFNELGLSISRNRAIDLAKGDICLLADDDVYYTNNVIDLIKKAFIKFPNVDIITFQIKKPNGSFYKSYPDNPFWYNKFSITKVSSQEIVMKLKNIKKHNIKFDTRFGLGAKYISSEEVIFLKDCLKKRLKILYLPIHLLIHPDDHSGINFTKGLLFSKGAVFLRLYGWKFFIFNFLFAILKFKEYRNKFSFFQTLKQLFLGSFDYLKNKI